MSRKYEVEQHPDKDKIIKAIIKGDDALRTIAGHYDISYASIQRYVSKGLTEKAAKAIEKRDLSDGKKIIAEIEKIMTRCRKMYDACDEYLTDPDNPDRYYLGPRSDEIEVVYYVNNENGNKTKYRDTLSRLLSEIKDTGKLISETKSKYADPRKLLLETANVLNGQLELIAKIQGQVVEMMQINADKVIIAPMVINKTEVRE